MNNVTILHKRGEEQLLPIANPSELLYTTDTEKLFYGGNDKNIEIAQKSELNAFSTVLLSTAETVGTVSQQVNSHLTGYQNDLAKKMNTTILYEGDMNNLLAEGFYYVHGTSINRPMDGASFYISVFRYNDVYMKQVAYRATGTPELASEVYMRQMVLGVWQDWVKLVNKNDLLPMQQIVEATAANQTLANTVNTDLVFASVSGADWASLSNGKVRLQPGKYDLIMSAMFAANITGQRAITPHLNTNTVNVPANTAQSTTTRAQACAKFTLTTATNLFLPAFQNTGAALSVSANVQITKVGDV